MFLGSPRSALIVGVTVPFAMVTAFILMYHAGISANLLSLGAIDFGIIVDGAIVMTEAILRRREAKPNEPLTESDVRDAARQVARPIFFSTAIIITTYLPLFAFHRIEAKLFHPMVYAVGFAQLGALAFALLVVPGLAYAAYRRPRRIFQNPDFVMDRADLSDCAGWLSASSELRISIKRRHSDRRACARLNGMARIPSRISTKGRFGCMPKCLPEFRYRKPPTWSPSCGAFSARFRKYRRVVSHIGHNDDGTDPWTPSHMEAAVVLAPYSTWPAGETKRDLVERMSKAFDRLPGFEIAFSQPIIDSVLDSAFRTAQRACRQSIR